jgi:hypothetical protein
VRDACWAIFDRYYDNTDRARFERDLSEKRDVFLLWAEGRIVGFSTVTVEEVGGVVSVFSGDTVIEHAYHGNTALQWAFFQYIAVTKLKNPHRTVAWFLISKGYKTYLLLAKNFVTFYPRRGVETPAWARQLIVTLASRRFGAALDPERLTLHFEADHEHLRPDVAPTEGQQDPDIAFFVAANPKHATGDELCCIGVVDAKLMLTFPVRQVLKRWRRRTAR